jgi:serine/threonine protein kinase
MQQEFQADQVPQRLLVSSSPSVFTERYTVMELLRSGGMGDIYLGFDKECRRPVAIKKIRKDLMGNREARFRFHAEAELTAGLEHPGIIPIYGRGVDADGREFYVMRLIAGDGSGTLADAIRRFHAVHGEYSQAHPRLNGQRLDELRDLLRRLKQVADAVAYAHSEGIVHRDLKPSNILCGVFGETWIGDWGLARHFIKFDRMEGGETYSLEDTQSSERQNDFPPATTGIGTPGYSAPELTQGGLSFPASCTAVLRRLAIGLTIVPYKFLEGCRCRPYATKPWPMIRQCATRRPRGFGMTFRGGLSETR